LNSFPRFGVIVALALTTGAVAADPIKRNMLGCVTEELLDEAIEYASKGDTNSMTQLVVAGQCFMLRAGQSVSVIKPGFTVATIRYNGVKLFTPSEAIR
jgi:hypothetical protein